ncbi:MAG: phosphoribosyltransferase family protein [Chloroflexota bacterium]|nr:phosphoribosyltransferase family protein [Chloroflexota bacterium]
MEKVKMSWTEYIKSIDQIAKHFKEVKFDVIIGLTRGGLIPAVNLSHIMDTPMLPFNPHMLHSNGDERSKIKIPISPAVIRKVLIVDDISDTGKTFDKCSKFFENRGFNVSTAAVYINKKTTIFTPTYSVYDSYKCWVVFPYEVE